MRSRRLLLRFLLPSLITSALAQSNCIYRNGSFANGDNFAQCPGVDWCCKRTDTCASNGLCIDINNHADGSLTDLGGTEFNFTGLYQTTTCINTDWNGCQTQCSSPQSSSFGYVWACNDALTEYCCLGDQGVGPYRACCQDNNQFELAKATLIPWDAVVTSTLSTTTSPAATGTTTVTVAPLSTSAASSGSGGLSDGTKIGIGVGVGLGVLVVGIFALFTLYHLRKNRSSRSPNTPSASEIRYQPAPQMDDMQRSPEGEQKVDTSYYGGVKQMSKQETQFGEMEQPPSELQGDFDHDRTSWKRQEMP